MIRWGETRYEGGTVRGEGGGWGVGGRWGKRERGEGGHGSELEGEEGEGERGD